MFKVQTTVRSALDPKKIIQIRSTELTKLKKNAYSMMTRKLMAVFSLPINWFTILHTVLYNTLIYYQMPFTVYTNTVKSRAREISKAGHSRQMSRNVTCLEAKKCCLLPCGYVPVQLHFDTTRAYKS